MAPTTTPRAPRPLPTWFGDLLHKTYKESLEYLGGPENEGTNAHAVSIALHLQDMITDKELGGVTGKYAQIASISGPKSAVHFVQQVMAAMLEDVKNGRYTPESMP
ncbi:MAG: hypothetical protein ABI862_07885 [Ilumatobacteraceae bacterium]